MDWFTSDLHFGHDKIIDYCERPCRDVADMRRMLVGRWQGVVAPTDRVWVLGDFALYLRRAEVEAVLRELPGEKHLIQGNHDHRDVYKAAGWASVAKYHELHLPDGPRVHLVHNPREVHLHNPMATGLVLHGHLHGNKGLREKPLAIEGLRFYDVGVDVDDHEYAPVNAQDVLFNLTER